MPAYPYNPDGATFECGQAVQNDANVVFVSAARFDAAREHHPARVLNPR